jgi:hypothetical protein
MFSWVAIHTLGHIVVTLGVGVCSSGAGYRSARSFWAVVPNRADYSHGICRIKVTIVAEGEEDFMTFSALGKNRPCRLEQTTYNLHTFSHKLRCGWESI